MYAAEAGNIGVVAYLLRIGADPKAVDNYGNTALSLAATSRHQNIVKVLIERTAGF